MDALTISCMALILSVLSLAYSVFAHWLSKQGGVKAVEKAVDAQLIEAKKAYDVAVNDATRIKNAAEEQARRAKLALLGKK